MKNKKPISEANERGRKSIKKIAILVLNFALLFVLYRIIIQLGENLRMPIIYYIGSMVYISAACGLFLAFYFINGGNLRSDIPKWDELPENWPDEKKADYLRKMPERKRKAKQLLYVFLPLLMVLLVSYIEIFLLA